VRDWLIGQGIIRVSAKLLVLAQGSCEFVRLAVAKLQIRHQGRFVDKKACGEVADGILKLVAG
jgi:hypothetical protein